MPGLFALFIDLLIPPRSSERLVRAMTPATLAALRHDDGLPYHDPRVTALIWELKYYANKKAATLCGPLIAEEVLARAAEEVGTPLLIPVPMHAARRRVRGHNQTELLCKAALRELTHIEYAPHVLMRTLDTKTQQGLPRHERLHNVRGSMRAHPHVAGRVCIVVDDVATTGATLAEAKRALRDAGARAVHTMALAQS